MAYLLNILTSIIVGGSLLLMYMSVDASLQQNSYENHIEYVVHSNLIDLTLMIENDFRKIGYRAISNPILSADSSSITFLADIDNNYLVDTVTYIIGDSTTAFNTSNPNDKLLFRIVNQDTIKSHNACVTNFKLSYFDLNGNPTSDLSFIKSISINIKVESVEKLEGRYLSEAKNVFVIPKNLNL
ncbi:MAG: hypothetical protein N3A61_03215 [Ignavibacteria bacterium]|nr:hypothetical protein [Ignavibacteria bacterium]